MTQVAVHGLDESQIRQALGQLPACHRIAFAAACCERLLPDYRAFVLVENWGSWESLRYCLDRIWKILDEGKSTAEHDLHGMIQQCEKVLPDTEDFPSVFGGLALNAAAAVIYTLECCLNGDSETSAMAARMATNSIDLYLRVATDPETGVHAADVAFGKWIEQAPLMKAELDQQQDDLDALRHHHTLDHEFLTSLRSRSASRGIQPILRGLVKAANT